MAARLDIRGRRRGRLVALEPIGEVRGQALWKWLCDCGSFVESEINNNTKSCGCSRLKHGMAHTAEYRIWHGMIQRCHNSKNKGFERYGARGITVHPDWRGEGGFERFFAHVQKRPSPTHSIDRVDGSRGYEPGNVRWATPSEQMRNFSRNHYLTHDGRNLTVVEWSETLGVPVGALYSRISWGWTDERVLTTPVAKTYAERARNKRTSKLTAADVAEIRGLLTERVPYTMIASRFGVSKGMIAHIKTGRQWA